MAAQGEGLVAAPMAAARAAFDALWHESSEPLVYVLHMKRGGRQRALRPFHPDVLLSMVVQTLASEDDVCGWPLWLQVRANDWRPIVPVDVPWVLAVQKLGGLPYYPTAAGACPLVYVLRHFVDAELCSALRTVPPRALGLQPREPRRPPRGKADFRTCALPSGAEDTVVLSLLPDAAERVLAHGPTPFPAVNAE